ncbi:type II secretion system F family protein, partial [bacterium]|nr:type II secretion system F family protein [bacterium]
MNRVLVRFADEQGNIRESIFETESPGNLRESLSQKGFYVLSEKILERRYWEALVSYIPFFSKVSLSSLTEMTQLLRTLIKAGLPIKEALEVLLEDASEGPLNKALLQVRTDIDEGNSFSSALSRHPTIFPEIYVKTTVAGEKAGALETVLGRLVSYYKATLAIRRKVFQALIYPAILLVIASGAILYLLIEVVPEFN